MLQSNNANMLTAAKTVYAREGVQMLKNAPPFPVVPKKGKTVDAQTMTFPLHTHRGFGAGARGTNEFLPSFIPGQMTSGTSSIKRLYCVGVYDKIWDHLQRSQASSFIDVIKTTRNDAVQSGRAMWAFSFIMDGTGVIFRTSGATTGVTLTCLHPISGMDTYGPALQYLRDASMSVRFYTSAGVDLGINRTITAIDWTNQQVTINSPANIPDGALAVMGSDEYGTSYNKLPMGLEYMLTDTANLYGINDKRWHPKVTSTVVSYNWEDIDMTSLRGRFGDGSGTDNHRGMVLVCHPAMKIEHTKAYGVQTEYTSGELDFKVGYKEGTVIINGNPVKFTAHIDVPYTRLYCFSSEDIEEHTILPWTQDTDSGADKQVANKDAKWFYYKYYGNFFPIGRGRMAVLNFATDATYANEIQRGV